MKAKKLCDIYRNTHQRKDAKYKNKKKKTHHIEGRKKNGVGLASNFQK